MWVVRLEQGWTLKLDRQIGNSGKLDFGPSTVRRVPTHRVLLSYCVQLRFCLQSRNRGR